MGKSSCCQQVLPQYGFYFSNVLQGWGCAFSEGPHHSCLLDKKLSDFFWLHKWPVVFRSDKEPNQVAIWTNPRKSCKQRLL